MLADFARSHVGSRLARLVVMVSGGGTNLQALLDACERGEIAGSIVGVVCNKLGAYALERAGRHGVPCKVLSLKECRAQGMSREQFDVQLSDAVMSFSPDLVLMAGFMHILSDGFFARFPPHMFLNVHPSLLPSDSAQDVVVLPDGSSSPVFRGHDAAAQAIACGVKWTGTSVHWVTVDVDRGPVLACEAVPVLPGDTPDSLQHRIQEVEHKLFPRVVAEVVRERLG